MKKIGNFEVFRRMAAENMDIMMCPDVANMTYRQKNKTTKVEFDAPGNVIGGIFNGDKRAIMLMWDMKQFRELKEKMEKEGDDE